MGGGRTEMCPPSQFCLVGGWQNAVDGAQSRPVTSYICRILG